jgi:hypothetical protein
MQLWLWLDPWVYFFFLRALAFLLNREESSEEQEK